MKAIWIVLGLFVLAACTAPSAELPVAQVSDEEQVLEPTTEPEDNYDEGIAVNEFEPKEIEETQEEEPQQIAINLETSSFEFEGFGPGKSHIGTFNEWNGNIEVLNGQIIGAQGTIQTNSVDTGIGGLDSHLKSDDFFDVTVHPEIVVKSQKITDDVLTGTITFRGVTKTVSFPVEVYDESIEAEFVLDITDFGFKYTGINPQVRLAFDMRI